MPLQVSGFDRPPSDCGSRFAELRTTYCFGEARAEELADFEAHLLICDTCWQELKRLDKAVSVLRNDRNVVEPELARAAIETFGVSARMDRPFGGHTWHVLAVSFLYALLYGTAVVLEVAYEYDAYRLLALIGAPAVFAWVFATTLLAFHLMHRQIFKGRSGLISGATVILAAATVTCVAMAWLLPGEPVTRATFQTYTAKAAFLKDTAYLLAVAAVLVIPPFLIVVGLQHLLKEKRHSLVLRCLTGDKAAVLPKSCFYVSPLVIGGLFIAMLVAALMMMTHLLDNLMPSPYTGLFQSLLWLRMAIFFLLGVEGLAWYHALLNDLKREAIASTAISETTPPAGSSARSLPN